MRKIAVTVLLSAFIAPPAVAADFYAGVNMGVVNFGYGNITNNGQTGFGVLGGYTVNRNVAVEVEYDSLGTFDDNSLGNTVKVSSLGFSGVGLWPINDQFSLFGKLGLASTTLKNSPLPGYSGGTYTDISTGLTFGFGGLLSFRSDAAIRFGYDNYPIVYAATTSSVGILYVGGVFKF